MRVLKQSKPQRQNVEGRWPEAGELLFHGFGVSVWEDAKVGEMDGGAGYTTV